MPLLTGGLTGATGTAGRIVGWAVTPGLAPASGTFLAGDIILDPLAALIWYCTVGGSPGTWFHGGAPLGSYMGLAGTTSAPGWLFCNGGTFSAGTYPALNTMLGGTTLPDLRGRFLLGADASGVLLSPAVALNALGGEQNHVLSVAELANHGHGGTDPTHTHPETVTTGAGGGVNAPQNSGPSTTTTSNSTGAASTGISIVNTGSGSGHNTMPPYRAANIYIFGF